MLFILLIIATAFGSDRGRFLDWVTPEPSSPLVRRLGGAEGTALEPAPPDATSLAPPGYRFAETMMREIATLVEDHPDRVEVERIGTSVQGRPLWAFHVGPDTAPTRTLIVGGMHALEWIGSEVALEVLTDLVRDPPPQGVRVTIVPLLNPDGRARVEADLVAGDPRYRRGNAVNIDLNRDFAVNREARAVWRKALPGYYATSPAPLSQPETRALDALADRERFHRAASLHSFGGYFYTPWAGRFYRTAPVDRREMWMLGRRMEAAWGRRAYRTRPLGRWAFFFRAHGAEIDHLYGRYGTRAFLVEIICSGVRLFHPKTWQWGFETYNPSQPRRYLRHRDRTARSLRALIDHPELPSERDARARGEHGLPPPLAPGVDESERARLQPPYRSRRLLSPEGASPP